MEDGISYPDYFLDELKKAHDQNIPIIALHNHPSGYPPSPDDFRKAYDNQYKYALVVGHNGQVYRYENHAVPLTERECDDIQLLIRLSYYQGYDVDRAYSENYEPFGLQYEILGGTI